MFLHREKTHCENSAYHHLASRFEFMSHVDFQGIEPFFLSGDSRIDDHIVSSLSGSSSTNSAFFITPDNKEITSALVRFFRCRNDTLTINCRGKSATDLTAMIMHYLGYDGSFTSIDQKIFNIAELLPELGFSRICLFNTESITNGHRRGRGGNIYDSVSPDVLAELMDALHEQNIPATILMHERIATRMTGAFVNRRFAEVKNRALQSAENHKYEICDLTKSAPFSGNAPEYAVNMLNSHWKDKRPLDLNPKDLPVLDRDQGITDGYFYNVSMMMNFARIYINSIPEKLSQNLSHSMIFDAYTMAFVELMQYMKKNPQKSTLDLVYREMANQFSDLIG